MAALIGLVIGALLGRVMLGEVGAVALALVGLFIGAIVSQRSNRERFRKPDPAAQAAAALARDGVAQPIDASAATADGAQPDVLARRVALLESRVAELERGLGRTPVSSSVDEVAMADASGAVPAMATDATDAAPAPAAALAQPSTTTVDERVSIAAPAPGTPPQDARIDVAEPVALAAERAIASTAAAATPQPPADAAPAPSAIRAFFTGANALARLGVLVLFIGVGFLLKYAAERVSVPIEMRLAAVALGAIALLVVGWRLRTRRAGYAMILQGGGVGVLYLTVFAALKLYELIPPIAAFALLFWIAVLSGWLAIRQEAMALAALGVLGGFAAPILTSTNAGNHVLLFSYYALLNAGILFVAWFRPWRVLNLLGFACTFVVATLWGVTRYRPEHFATTEPFLVLFFLFYIGIAVLYALRRSAAVRDYVDGTLVFGTPLAAAALQQALVRDTEFAMAASAIVASAVYLAAGAALKRRHRDDLRLLIESFLALGVVFATLAVPLAFDSRWTSGTWALEGAALLWIGLRQRRRATRLFGLALQLAAGAAFGVGLMNGGSAQALPLLNSDFIGAALVALAGLYSAWLYHAHDGAADRIEKDLASLVFGWGLVWWFGAGYREIVHWLAPQARLAAIVAALAANAALFAFVAHRLRWTLALVPAALALPALLVAALVAVLSRRYGFDHPFAHGGALAWPFALIVTLALLRHFERPDETSQRNMLDTAHAGFAWVVALLGASETAWAIAHLVDGAPVWRLVGWALFPAAMLAAITAMSSRDAWPVGAHRRAYLVLASLPVAAWLAIWSLATNARSDGDPGPLPFVPLLNPLDLTQGFVLAALAAWTLRRRSLAPGVHDGRSREFGAGALLLFVWINALVLRAIHHAFDIDYAFQPMWRSALVQAALSLLWSACALATMVWSNRRGERAGWMTGATLLAVVVAKLFFVDLSGAGTIERIVSFIGVGLLLLLVGYLAPVPARNGSQ